MFETIQSFVSDKYWELGIAFGIAAGFVYDSWQQKKALETRHMGFKHAELSYTVFEDDPEQPGKKRQTVWTIDDNLDLTEVFNNRSNKRYLYYFEKAAELALESDNKHVLDHLRKATSERYISSCLRTWGGSIGHKIADYVPERSGEAHEKYFKSAEKVITNKIRKRLGASLPMMAEKHWHLFEGSDPTSDRAYVYPAIIATDSSDMIGVKIYLLTMQDLSGEHLPQGPDDVLVELDDETYGYDPENKHAKRIVLIHEARARFNSDGGAMRKRKFVRIPMNLDYARDKLNSHEGVLRKSPDVKEGLTPLS